MSIIAKFRCNNVDTQTAFPPSESVSLSAVIDDSPENKSWSEATPSGRLDMNISNPGAQGFFKSGEEYFIEIRKADEPSTKPSAD